MRTAILYSGGKDSNLSLWRLAKAGHDIVALISAVSDRDDSWMFHTPNVDLCRYQAECLEIPWEAVKVSGVKEAEVEELATAISRLKKSLTIEAIGTGAIASKYQRERVGSICSKLGLGELSPLWGQSEVDLLREMLSLGFEIYFTSVSAEGLGKEWLGVRLDKSSVSSLLRLKALYNVNISGEGGEYETFVADMPLFRQRIEILKAQTNWSHNSGTWAIKKIKLVHKPPFPS